MAIQWTWDNKVGEAIFEQTFDGNTKQFTNTLYNGNAYLIFLNEWTEDGVEKYSLHSFFADRKHMKIMLGLEKGSDGTKVNYFNTNYSKLVKIRLNKKCRYLSEIIGALVRAFDNLEIEIYSEEEL